MTIRPFSTLIASVAAPALLINLASALLPPAAHAAATAPEIVVGPIPAAGEALDIRITGLVPGQTVAVDMARTGYYGIKTPYISRNQFRAGSDGTVRFDRDAPIEGSYSGVDATGPFWSMKPTNNPLPGIDPNTDSYHISVDLDGDGASDLSRSLPTSRAAQATTRIDLGPDFPGAVLARPAGTARIPAIISLGGSEGGSQGAKGDIPHFVDRGYAVLALPYFSPNYGGVAEIPELPAAFADIPLDRLDAARRWLCARPDIDCARIGVIGVSKGAEFALAATSRMPGFAAVAAIVPSDVIWEGWGNGVVAGQRSSFSYQGGPLAFVPYKDMNLELAKYAQGKADEVRFRTPHDRGRAANPERISDARIVVENIAAPVLVAGGDLDAIWNSGGMTRIIAASRAAVGLETESLVFTDADHGLSGTPMEPGQITNVSARKEIFPAVVAFFAKHLKP